MVGRPKGAMQYTDRTKAIGWAIVDELKERRKRKGMSRAEYAKLLHVTRKRVENVEDHAPSGGQCSLTWLIDGSAALGCDPTDVLVHALYRAGQL